MTFLVHNLFDLLEFQPQPLLVKCCFPMKRSLFSLVQQAYFAYFCLLKFQLFYHQPIDQQNHQLFQILLLKPFQLVFYLFLQLIFVVLLNNLFAKLLNIPSP